MVPNPKRPTTWDNHIGRYMSVSYAYSLLTQALDWYQYGLVKHGKQRETMGNHGNPWEIMDLAAKSGLICGDFPFQQETQILVSTCFTGLTHQRFFSISFGPATNKKKAPDLGHGLMSWESTCENVHLATLRTAQRTGLTMGTNAANRRKPWQFPYENLGYAVCGNWGSSQWDLTMKNDGVLSGGWYATPLKNMKICHLE